MLIDTHVHYNLEPFFSINQEKQVKLGEGIVKYAENWQNHWAKAQEAGVNKSIVVGTDFISSTLATKIATSQGLFASVGCHPNVYHEDFLNAQSHKVSSFESLFEDAKTDIEELGLIIQSPKVVAIGETGLDYYRLPSEGHERKTVIELQKFAFQQHILLAKKHHLPLVLHVRDKEVPEESTSDNAYWDALALLKKHDVHSFTLHCASGPLSYIEQAVELGAYVGFDGNITYPNAHQIRQIFQIVPETRRLVETDAPFLPPQEFRGKTCEPWMLVKTMEYIENELQTDRQSFAQNAEDLFLI